jgi:Zn-dependent protease with chaperone function
MVVFLWVAGLLYLLAKKPDGTPRWDLVIEALAWPVIAVLLANMLALRPRAKQFRQRDQHSRVMSTNYPEVFRALGEYARLCGLRKPPELFLLPEERCFMFTMPAKGGTIVASRALKERLRPEEFNALLAHEMGHILAHHVRMELAIVYIRGANPLLKFVLLPVTVMSVLMAGWLDAIDYSADRCAYLLTGGQARIINNAMIKMALAAEPQPELTMEELEEFLNAPGEIEADQVSLERQIRVRRFMDQVPNLRDRVEALSEFPKTPQCQAAMERLAQLLRPGASTG